MRFIFFTLLFCLLASDSAYAAGEGKEERRGAKAMPTEALIQLPAALRSGSISLEETLQRRRSIRSYSDQALKLAEIAQLLWAAQGISEPRRGFRTAPSAGATFPLEVLVAVGNVVGLPAGLYRYLPHPHALELVASGDLRPALHRAALNQSSVLQAPVVFIITAVPRRTEIRYGQRATRYIQMETGHAAQNLSLQAVALEIGTVVIGAFRDTEVATILDLPAGEVPLYLIPAGKI